MYSLQHAVRYAPTQSAGDGTSDSVCEHARCDAPLVVRTTHGAIRACGHRITAQGRSSAAALVRLENLPTALHLGHVPAHIAQLFVHFLEGRQIVIRPETAPALRRLAHQYEALELRQRCERVLATERRVVGAMGRAMTSTLSSALTASFAAGSRLLDRAAVLGLQQAGFARRHLATPEGSVHILDAKGRGALPPILFLHGIGSQASDCGALLQRLRRDFRRVIAPDMPGHGWSDTPASGMHRDAFTAALLGALDSVVDEPVTVFGNSMGGLAAIRLVQARPALAHKLILASPAGAPMSGEELWDFLDTFRMESLAEARTFAARLYARRSWLHPLIAGGMRARFRRPAFRDLLANARSSDFLRPDELHDLALPTLVIWGRQDRVFPRGHLRFFQANLPPTAVVSEPEGFGHCPFFDDVDTLVDQLASFCRGQVATTQRPHR